MNTPLVKIGLAAYIIIYFLGGTCLLFAGAFSDASFGIMMSALSAFWYMQVLKYVKALRIFKNVEAEMNKQPEAAKKPDKKANRSGAYTLLQYEDKGQTYEYIVSLGGDKVHCYSDVSYTGFDGMSALIETLEKDGKLSL